MLADNQIQSIRQSWSQDTCYPPSQKNWSASDPALGQCAVTALLVQDLHGGEILFSRSNNHYWNRIDGIEIDLTKEQFDTEIDTSDKEVVTRTSLFHSARGKTQERYDLLKNRFNQTISTF